MTRHALTLAALLCCTTTAASAGSLTLSPAVVPLSGKPGQSTTQHVTLTNGTELPLSFVLVAKDVVVRGGARQFVPAGDVTGSVAATAVFSTRTVALAPGEEKTVDVTVTLPSGITQRALVVLFQGTTRVGKQAATVSLGSLLTFDLAGKQSLAVAGLHATPPTASTNAAFSVPLHNDGSEPMIARAAVAIVTPTGTMIGRATIEPRRLLPGEQVALQADYPGDLAPGHYRVLATIESGHASWTRSAELVVP